jgi:hypothetical protein
MSDPSADRTPHLTEAQRAVRATLVGTVLGLVLRLVARGG